MTWTNIKSKQPIRLESFILSAELLAKIYLKRIVQIVIKNVDKKEKQLRIGLAGLGNVGAGVYKNLDILVFSKQVVSEKGSLMVAQRWFCCLQKKEQMNETNE